MNIELISHASILITCGDTKILTDPWYQSKAFNDSWTLLATKELSESELRGIEYIWISHEHPDHFNVPTLRAFPDWFKKQVTILFQTKNSEKLFTAMKNWGFEKFQSLPNQRLFSLTSAVQVYCYPTHLGDSCLGVRYNGQNVFNINDAELGAEDCQKILQDFGDVDVITNQFSLAGYLGFANYSEILPKVAEDKLERLANNHQHLQANLTIPFASFVYFSTVDNQFMNQYANTPETVTRYMAQKHLKTHFMEIGEVFDLEHPELHDRGLNYWQDIFRGIDTLEYSESPVIDFEKIETAANDFTQKLYTHYPRPLLWLIGPLTIFIPDLNLTVRYSVKEKTCRIISKQGATGDADLTVYSQPLWYGFKFNWGFETLAVSSRILVNQNYFRWKVVKNLSILMNQEIYLKLSHLRKGATLNYLTERLSNGLAKQILFKSLSNLKLHRS